MDLPASLQVHFVFHVLLLKLLAWSLVAQWPLAINTAAPSRQKPIPKKKSQNSKKAEENEEKKNSSEDFKEAFEVKRILKENWLHFKVHWLGYDMTHNSWVNKEEIEENAPEVLATH